MIFEQSFFDNFLSHTHMIILLSLSIALIFVSLPKLLCKIWLSNKLSQEMIFQIILLYFLREHVINFVSKLLKKTSFFCY